MIRVLKNYTKRVINHSNSEVFQIPLFNYLPYWKTFCAPLFVIFFKELSKFQLTVECTILINRKESLLRILPFGVIVLIRQKSNFIRNKSLKSHMFKEFSVSGNLVICN